MQIIFTSEAAVSRADEIVAYLLGPRLWIARNDYPDFEAWAQKVHGQLKSEDKRALVALVAGQVAGAVIYQRHLSDQGALEIKNISVRPDQQGRHIAGFLLRNAEIEGQRDFGSTHALVDAKARNAGIGLFLAHERYRPLAATDLYGLGAGQDVVFRKDLGSSIAQPRLR
jgi:L-amino acid N-acyltransferase YncA